MNALRPITVTLAVAVILHTSVAVAQSAAVPTMVPSECGGPEITNAYGPFDYTNPTHFRERLPIVETYHFTLKVETLEAGETGTEPGGDLDYTLRAFPNHHRALYAMGRYQLMHPDMVIAQEARWTADCYFQGAMAMEDYDAARHHAARAQDLGFPLPGARGRLERLGEWHDSRADNDE